jgi:alpha-L-arabinofuranosidase
MHPALARFALIAVALIAPAIAAERVELSVDASRTGPKIDRNIFGQFAEHLGYGMSRWGNANSPRVDSVNTFEAPSTVVPEPVVAKVQGGKVALKVEPKPVTVVSVEQ